MLHFFFGKVRKDMKDKGACRRLSGPHHFRVAISCEKSGARDLYLENCVRVAYSLAEIKATREPICRLNAIVPTPASSPYPFVQIFVEMNRDTSNMSDSSRSPSPASDVSAQDSVTTANTDFEHAAGLRHFLLLSDKCKSIQELDSALRALPLRPRSHEYLILALHCTRGAGHGAGSAVTITRCLEEFGRAVGSEKIFDKWFMGPAGNLSSIFYFFSIRA